VVNRGGKERELSFFGLLELPYSSIGLGLNLSGHATCLSGGARAWNAPLLNRVTSLTGEHRGGVGNLALRLLRIVEVITIAIIFSLPMVLSYPSTCIVVGQAPVATRRGCWLASVSFLLDLRSVTIKGLAPMIFGRRCHYDDVACYMNPLLGQGDKWRV
jgi:hypothetical protein